MTFQQNFGTITATLLCSCGHLQCTFAWYEPILRARHFAARSCVDVAHTKFLTISVIRTSTIKASEAYQL